jgi:hypothetical protein
LKGRREKRKRGREGVEGERGRVTDEKEDRRKERGRD